MANMPALEARTGIGIFIANLRCFRVLSGVTAGLIMLNFSYPPESPSTLHSLITDSPGDILSLLSLSTVQTKAIRTIVRHLGPDSSHQNVPDSGRNHESRGLQLAGPDVRAKNATYSFAHPRGRPSPGQGSWLWNQPCWYVSPEHPPTHLMIPNGPGVVLTCRNVHPPRSLAGH